MVTQTISVAPGCDNENAWICPPHTQPCQRSWPEWLPPSPQPLQEISSSLCPWTPGNVRDWNEVASWKQRNWGIFPQWTVNILTFFSIPVPKTTITMCRSPDNSFLEKLNYLRYMLVPQGWQAAPSPWNEAHQSTDPHLHSLIFQRAF